MVAIYNDDNDDADYRGDENVGGNYNSNDDGWCLCEE